MLATPCNCHECVLAEKKEEVKRMHSRTVNKQLLVEKLIGYKLSGNSEVFSLGIDDATRIVNYLIESIND